MSYRVEVLIPDDLEVKLREAAKNSHVSEEEWVRRVIERSLASRETSKHRLAALARLESLNAPTSDMKQMLAEIEAGRQ